MTVFELLGPSDQFIDITKLLGAMHLKNQEHLGSFLKIALSNKLERR